MSISVATTMDALSERVPGLRPDAPRRNVLVVFVYLLSALVGVGLLDSLVGIGP